MLEPQREVGKHVGSHRRGKLGLGGRSEEYNSRGLVEIEPHTHSGNIPVPLVSCSSCLGFMSKQKNGFCLPLSLSFGDGADDNQ